MKYIKTLSVAFVLLCNAMITYAQFIQPFEEGSPRPPCWNQSWGSFQIRKLVDDVSNTYYTYIDTPKEGGAAFFSGENQTATLQTPWFTGEIGDTVSFWYAKSQLPDINLTVKLVRYNASNPPEYNGTMISLQSNIPSDTIWQYASFTIPEAGLLRLRIEANVPPSTRLVIDEMHSSANINGDGTENDIPTINVEQIECNGSFAFQAVNLKNYNSPLRVLWFKNRILVDSANILSTDSMDVITYSYSGYVEGDEIQAAIYGSSPCGEAAYGDVRFYSKNLVVNSCPTSDSIHLASLLNKSFCAGEATVFDAFFYTSIALTTYEIQLSPDNLFSSPVVLGSGSVSPVSSTLGGSLLPGKYYLRIQAATGDNSVNIDSIVINPLPTADAGTDDNICFGSSAILTASGGTNYTWDNGLGAGASHVISPAFDGTYIVTVSNASGCTDTDTVTITVNTLPTANAGVDDNICLGGSAILTATGGIGYTWDKGLGAGSSHTVSPIVNTIYTVIVSDVNGCTDTDSITIKVNSLPVADAGIADTIDYNTSVLLDGSGSIGNMLSYAWSPSYLLDDSSSVSPTTVKLSGISPQIFTLQVTDTNGCTDTDEVKINLIYAVDVIISPDSNSALDVDTSICEGDSIALFANSSGGYGNYTYNWSSVPVGFTSSANTITVSPITDTRYILEVTDVITLNKAIDTIVVFYRNNPVVTIMNDTSVFIGGSISLNAEGGSTYNWMPINEIRESNKVSNPEAVPSSPTMYIQYIRTKNK